MENYRIAVLKKMRMDFLRSYSMGKITEEQLEKVLLVISQWIKDEKRTL